VIINFWATWCAPCRREMPSLVALKERLGGAAPEILAVSIDDDRAAVHEYLARTPLPFRILLDPGRVTADRFAVSTVPSTFIVDAEGRVVERVDGEVDWSSPDILATVERLVAKAGEGGRGV
jgi:thiol-disulfide isomerase/thioredoxin